MSLLCRKPSTRKRREQTPNPGETDVTDRETNEKEGGKRKVIITIDSSESEEDGESEDRNLGDRDHVENEGIVDDESESGDEENGAIEEENEGDASDDVTDEDVDSEEEGEGEEEGDTDSDDDNYEEPEIIILTDDEVDGDDEEKANKHMDEGEESKEEMGAAVDVEEMGGDRERESERGEVYHDDSTDYYFDSWYSQAEEVEGMEIDTNGEGEKAIEKSKNDKGENEKIGEKVDNVIEHVIENVRENVLEQREKETEQGGGGGIEVGATSTVHTGILFCCYLFWLCLLLRDVECRSRGVKW